MGYLHFELNKHYREVSHGCHEWIRCTNVKGYPVVGGGWAHKRGLSILAYKIAWEEAHGPVPTGHTLDHLCRNRRCIRIEHIQCVPHSTNVRRGRKTKITDTDVRSILQMTVNEIPSKLISEHFAISQGQVRNIVTGKSWGDIHNDLRDKAIAAKSPTGFARMYHTDRATWDDRITSGNTRALQSMRYIPAANEEMN